LSTDLLANWQNLAAINAATAGYRIASATVSGTVTGLVRTDRANIQITDPASAVTASSASAYTVSNVTASTGNLVGGGTSPWRRVVSLGSGAGTTYGTLTDTDVSTSAGATATSDFTLVPATPTLSSTTPASQTPGAALTLTGTNFWYTTANGATATDRRAANVITIDGVTVPDGSKPIPPARPVCSSRFPPPCVAVAAMSR
jgi:hypothetical protein